MRSHYKSLDSYCLRYMSLSVLLTQFGWQKFTKFGARDALWIWAAPIPHAQQNLYGSLSCRSIYRVAQKSLDTKANAFNIERQLPFEPSCILNQNILQTTLQRHTMTSQTRSFARWITPDTYYSFQLRKRLIEASYMQLSRHSYWNKCTWTCYNIHVSK
jgi:hypothetical protein